MDTHLNIDVSSLDTPHRRALEEVLGQNLQSDQCLHISVTQVEKTSSVTASQAQTLEDWTNIFSVLSAEKSESITQDVTRANLTRNLP